MRLLIIFLVLSALAAGAYFLTLQGEDSRPVDFAPEVLRLERYQATIAWRTKELSGGRILFRPAGTDVPPESANQDMAQSYLHEVTLQGLSPATRYTYWLEKDNLRHQFQTEPEPGTPFSFLLWDGTGNFDAGKLLFAELPEFFVSLADIDHQADPFAEIRSAVPVYGPQGPDSPLLKQLSPQTDTAPASWAMAWGGFRLIVLRNMDDLPGLLSPNSLSTGIVLLDASASSPEAPLHDVINAHNTAEPQSPVAFVLLPGSTAEPVQMDGVTYAPLPRGVTSIRVDADSARARGLTANTSLLLREPPLKKKLTCEECRRLADRGSYEESVKAYMDFIAANAGHFQVDDAYYAIAEISDEKLFDFRQALTWYKRLLTEHPSSTLAPLAKQRVDALTQVPAKDYPVLADFERIRKVEYGRAQDPASSAKLLRQVNGLVRDNPESSLVPAMLHWLATQHRADDPNRAVELLRELRQRFPGHEETAEIPLEIGDVWYQAEQWEKARQAYAQALAELKAGAWPEAPGRTDAVLAQLHRSERNLLRVTLARVSAVVLALGLLAAVAVPPAGVGRRHIVRAAFVLAGLSAIIWSAGWLIREQFSSSREALLLAVSLAASASLAGLVSCQLTDKLLPTSASLGGVAARTLAGSLMAALLLLAGGYQAMYIVNKHYLILFGL